MQDGSGLIHIGFRRQIRAILILTSMPPEPSSSPILFGREPDLAHLLDRVQRSGVTAVIARAQMGKSALLNELSVRLTQRPDGNLFKAPLVGITESLGETSDLLLRAVSSLYTRWIASSSFREQGGVSPHSRTTT